MKAAIYQGKQKISIVEKREACMRGARRSFTQKEENAVATGKSRESKEGSRRNFHYGRKVTLPY